MLDRRGIPLLGSALLLACGNGRRADTGLRAALRVEGASYVEGAPPRASGGPAIAALLLDRNYAVIGSVGTPMSGTLAREATAVAIDLVGDGGYWILPAGLASAITPGYPTFQASLTLASTLEPGKYTLSVSAADRHGRYGVPTTAPLTALPRAVAAGDLVVALSWDTESDLDLHVVDPSGAEIYAKDINSYAIPPGQLADADAAARGGILDFDSNASCVIDGRRVENVVWSADPPTGRYTVRVDTFSLCNEPAARWSVMVLLHGQVTARAAGMSTPGDTRFTHARGSGVLALEFDVK